MCRKCHWRAICARLADTRLAGTPLRFSSRWSTTWRGDRARRENRHERRRTQSGGVSAELCALRDRLGLKAKVLQIEGDDLLSQLEPLQKAGRELKRLDMGQPLRDLRARDLRGYAWLEKYLTAERLKQLVTENAGLEVRRYELLELEGFELRCRRPSMRRRGFVGPIRPASQKSGRISALADG